MDRPQQLGSIWPIPEVAKRNRNEDEKDERRGLDDRHHLEALELFELDARYLCMVIVRILFFLYVCGQVGAFRAYAFMRCAPGSSLPGAKSRPGPHGP